MRLDATDGRDAVAVRGRFGARAWRGALVALVMAGPGQAQTTAPELRLPQQLDQALRDMMQGMKPALDTLKMLGEIDAVEHYGVPRLLPNGDILIPRRPDAPPVARPEAPGLRT